MRWMLHTEGPDPEKLVVAEDELADTKLWQSLARPTFGTHFTTWMTSIYLTSRLIRSVLRRWRLEATRNIGDCIAALA